MLTPRENYLTTLYGGNADYVPNARLEMQMCGFAVNDVLEKPLRGGTDAFGCEWAVTKEGPMNKPGFALFEEIGDWKEHFIKPDLSQYDFKAMAEAEAKVFPQLPEDGRINVFFSQGDQWMRMISYMGFENALIALAEDPDACKELLAAYTEVKLQTVDIAKDVYNADAYCLGEDTASARSMFMSPDTYREIIKPFHKAMCDKIRSRGMLPMIHTCGKCEEIIPDYIEIGVKGWHSAQTMNDLPGLLEKYGRQIGIMGGWESTGPCSYLADDDTDEALRAETIRCLNTYKIRGYILFPLILGPNGMVNRDPRLEGIKEEWEKLRWY